MLKPTLTLALVAALGLSSCSDGDPAPPEVRAAGPEYLMVASLAGAATVEETASPDALAVPAPNLTAENLEKHLEGDANFELGFVPRPEGGLTAVGLGPVFNNSSCIACHNRDGRGVLPPVASGQRVKLGGNAALLIRLSIEGAEAPLKDEAHGWGAPAPVPGFSAQLFHRGIYGMRPDSFGSGQADVYLSYETRSFTYPDGSRTIVLRKPVFEIENAYDGEATRLKGADVRTSPRLAPPMVGLGLLESIPEARLLAQADPEDRDGDGISGKPNWVHDLKKSYEGNPVPISLGRFGFKASNPTLRQQSVAALNNDMGVTSTWLPRQSIFGTPLFETYLTLLGDTQMPEIEADDAFVDSITHYSATLGVPARRKVNDASVLQGGRAFERLQCATCHSGGYRLDGQSVVAEFNGLKIYPFTDLLLHDMGDDLADDRRDFDADGREWKTPALWGVGIAQLVNPRASFLHDGRARTLEEAILWHGGEAQRSRDEFTRLAASERDALLQFLSSL